MLLAGTWIFQVILCIAILEMMVKEHTSLHANGESEDVGIMFGISRFFCSILMHMLINNRVKNGLLIMKYAVNHEWKFQAPIIAFFTGFLQVTASVLIALVNYVVIETSPNILELCKEFCALAVLA